jgi:hypothetical protein
LDLLSPDAKLAWELLASGTTVQTREHVTRGAWYRETHRVHCIQVINFAAHWDANLHRPQRMPNGVELVHVIIERNAVEAKLVYEDEIVTVPLLQRDADVKIYRVSDPN